MIRLDVTSSAVAGDPENLEKCREAACDFGFEFGVQLHNSATRETVDELCRAGVPLSAHAPVLSEYTVNLAMADGTLPMSVLEKNVAFFRENGIAKSVFHGFVMTDTPIHAFRPGLSYDACMGAVRRPELMWGESRFNRADIAESEEFRMRTARVRERLAEIRRRWPDICFCVENDFPSYGSGDVFAETLRELDHPVCLDTGHLWISAHLYDRDFAREADRILAETPVKMAHVHASKYTDAVPKFQWSDGHLPFATPNRMNLPPLIRRMAARGVEHFVLEIIAATPEDIRYFGRALSDRSR